MNGAASGTGGKKRVVVLMETMATLGGAQKYGAMMLAPLAARHDVEVLVGDSATVDRQRLTAMFGQQLKGVRFTHVKSTGEILQQSRRADLFINVSYASLVPNAARRGIYVVFFPVPIADGPGAGLRSLPERWLESARQRALASIRDADPEMFAPETSSIASYRKTFGAQRTLCRLPLFALRKAAWTGYRDLRLGSRALGSYDRLLAISEFTSYWTRRNYGITPDYLHPPIDTQAFVPLRKQREIIAVGRFDDGENSKKLHVVLQAFCRLQGEGLLSDWKLRFCGATGGAESQAYLQRLRDLAAGHPVEFHPDLPFPELVRSYGEATLFWHAMGHGEDAALHPWRCEHFGMATAEAMSAGCVPMVFRAGGQPEIVGEDRRCGYLWSSFDELREAVLAFQALPSETVQNMGALARTRTMRFSHDEFLRTAAQIYGTLGITAGETDARAEEPSSEEFATACLGA